MIVLCVNTVRMTLHKKYSAVHIYTYTRTIVVASNREINYTHRVQVAVMLTAANATDAMRARYRSERRARIL